MKVKVKWSGSRTAVSNICDPMACSLPGSSVHGILQAKILEWIAISFSRGSSPPRDWTWVSCTAGGFFTNWDTRETQVIASSLQFRPLTPSVFLQVFEWKILIEVSYRWDIQDTIHVLLLTGWTHHGSQSELLLCKWGNASPEPPTWAAGLSDVQTEPQQNQVLGMFSVTLCCILSYVSFRSAHYLAHILNQHLAVLSTYHLSHTLISTSGISQRNLEKLQEFLLSPVWKDYS